MTEIHQHRHVSRLSIQMHGYHRPHARREAALACGKVNEERVAIDVDDHRTRANGHDGERRERCRHRRNENLVAGPDACRAQQQCDGICSIADADREAGPRGIREFRFEGLELGTEHEPPAGQHSVDGRTNLGGVLARTEIEERQCCGVHDALIVGDIGT
jgi:hypothetical protein